MTETIEQAAERLISNYTLEDKQVFLAGVTWQSSQPNPHRIKVAHVRQAFDLFFNEQITFPRMVEILNEIAEGRHKERIEI